MKNLNLTRRLCTLAVAGLLLASVTLVGLAQSAMPSAETLEKLAKEASAKFKDDKSGKNADYIPALAKVPSNLFGITIVTLDGKVINVGDVDYCLDAKHVPKVLSVMTMAGFYDGSGAWAWNAGLPAKTGVGGGIVAVVPSKMSIVGFPPPLDKFGNSVRAREAIRYTSEQLDLNIFGSSK